jgi:hypothetical protein
MRLRNPTEPSAPKLGLVPWVKIFGPKHKGRSAMYLVSTITVRYEQKQLRPHIVEKSSPVDAYLCYGMTGETTTAMLRPLPVC